MSKLTFLRQFMYNYNEASLFFQINCKFFQIDLKKFDLDK